MYRGRLIIGLIVVAIGPSAFAQGVIQPYSEPVMSPYGDEPAPPAAQQLPPVPPPVVAPPPPGYQYQYQQPAPGQPYAQQPYYYYQTRPQPTFHEEMQPRYGLMVAGLVIFGASWSINAASA